jgi:hypothetical protein
MLTAKVNKGALPMNALHIDVASLTTDQMIALASAGILKFDAPTQPDTVQETVTVETDEISVNASNEPDSHVDYPSTWTRERLNATTVKGKNAPNRLQHVANANGITNFNGIMYPSRHGSAPVQAINDAVDALPNSAKFSPKDRLVEAILLQVANGTVASQPVKPVTPKVITHNAAQIARVQAELRKVNAEIDTIDALPDAAKAYTTDRRDELASMADQLIADLDALNVEATSHDPFAAVVNLPATKREVKQASIAAMGRLNPTAWGDDKAGRMRQPTVIRERYDNAAKHAKFIRETYALMQGHLQTATGKDERKAIYDKFNELTSQIGEDWISGCRNSETSVDHWQVYVYLRDDNILPNPVFSTLPTREALEAKAAKLNRDPSDVARSNRARKAAKTRKANARNK